MSPLRRLLQCNGGCHAASPRHDASPWCITMCRCCGCGIDLCPAQIVASPTFWLGVAALATRCVWLVSQLHLSRAALEAATAVIVLLGAVVWHCVRRQGVRAARGATDPSSYNLPGTAHRVAL